MTALPDQSLRSVVEAVQCRNLHPLEVVEAALARIHAADDVVHAWVCVDEDNARRQALELAEALSRGDAGGPLTGAVIGVKDIIDVAGLVTANGSRIHSPVPAARDASVVRTLRRAGAIVLGKTHTIEFATGNLFGVPTRNPWATDRIAGGSSSGSAVAVAMGMCSGTLGTDSAGSIRIPAALCGVAGLKPRSQAVPLDGITTLSWTLDSCGPIARDAADLELMWRALDDCAPTLPSRKLVVGVPADLQQLAPVDPEIAALFEAAVAELVDDDGRSVAVTLAPAMSYDRDRSLRLLAEAVASHKHAGRFPDLALEYEEETLRQLSFGAELSADELVQAELRLKQGMEREYREALGHVDVVALPTTIVTASPVEDANGQERDGLVPRLVRTLTALCGQVNWCGLAAVSVPCGLTREGLPVGLQLIGHDEAAVLGAALRYERVVGPRLMRPPILAALAAHTSPPD